MPGGGGGERTRPNNKTTQAPLQGRGRRQGRDTMGPGGGGCSSPASCMYACTHACTYVWGTVPISIYASMYACNYVRMCMHVLIYVCVCMYVCMYVGFWIELPCSGALPETPRASDGTTLRHPVTELAPESAKEAVS